MDERRSTVVFGATLTLLMAGFAYELWRHLPTAGDFWTFWAAARALHANLDPYLAANLTRVAVPPKAPGSFLSPLVVAEVMEPLGALPFHIARFIWLGISLTLSAILVPLVLRQGGIPCHGRSVLAATALLLAFQPYNITLWLGQTDVFVVVAIAGGWFLMERGRPYLGGLVLSIAAIDIHFLPIFGLYLLVSAAKAERRAALFGLVTGLAAIGVACLAHPADVIQWIFVTLPHAQASAIEPWDTLSVLQATSELFGVHAGRIVTGFLDLAVIGFAIALWRRSGSPERDLAVCAVAALATTTFGYNQDYLLLVLAFPYLARLWRLGASRSWICAMAFSLAVGYGLAELTGGPVAPNHALFLLGSPLLALIVLWNLPSLRTAPSRIAWRWASVWFLATIIGYALLTAVRNEIGLEVTMLAGLFAFLTILGLHERNHPAPGHPGSQHTDPRPSSLAPGRAGTGTA